MNEVMEQRIQLKPIWLKAAVLGGLWASIEIIIGSFFHNMRLPFAGTILAANATVLMVAFYQVWPEKGLIWRAGLIAALMKSVSPSAIILGPMIGIMTEALIIEFFIRIFGNNFLSLTIAGALCVSSALMQKIVNLLIIYGFNIVKLYVDVFNYLARQLRMENADPWIPVFLAFGIYIFLGVFAVVTGLRIGKRAKTSVGDKSGFSIKNKTNSNFFALDPNQKFSVFLFVMHVLLIPAGLVWLNNTNILYGFIFVLIYTSFCILRYKRSLRRLKKPMFWGQLFLLTIIATIFWKGIDSNGFTFNKEGLFIGLEMNIRAIFVVIAFSSFGVELRNPVIRDFLFRKGFDKVYSALGLSFSALPVMIEAMPKPKKFLRHPIFSFSLMIVHAREWLDVFEGSKSNVES